MPGEKTGILAHLKKLRADSPARWKLLSGAVLVCAASMATAIAVIPGQSVQSSPAAAIIAQIAHPTPVIQRDDERPFIRQGRIRTGETLGNALRRLGLSDTKLVAQANTPAILKHFKGMLPGALLTVATSASGTLHSASITKQGTDTEYLLEPDNGALQITLRPVQLQEQIHMQAGVVQSSLFAAMDDIGLPDSVAEELSRIFGDDIDFHSDLRRGDRFSVIYEIYYHQGHAVRTGRILAAEFINRGVRHSAFLFRHPDGSEDYYGQDGKSHKDGFLRSPLEFSRVSSGFSMRQHPIFGTWREHKGVDYAAPHVRDGRLVEAHDIAGGLAQAPALLERVARGATAGRPLVDLTR